MNPTWIGVLIAAVVDPAAAVLVACAPEWLPVFVLPVEPELPVVPVVTLEPPDPDPTEPIEEP